MASDIGGAVAALQAAGEDIDALITAVGKAKFLDEIPGEDRQKLRGGFLAVIWLSWSHHAGRDSAAAAASCGHSWCQGQALALSCQPYLLLQALISLEKDLPKHCCSRRQLMCKCDIPSSTRYLLPQLHTCYAALPTQLPAPSFASCWQRARLAEAPCQLALQQQLLGCLQRSRRT